MKPHSTYSDRRTAQRAGSSRYYTGQPCKHGHLADRFVSNGGCSACINWRVDSFVNSPNVRTLQPIGFPPDCVPTVEEIEQLHTLLHANARSVAAWVKAPPLTALAVSQGFTVDSLRAIGYSLSQMIVAGYLEPLVLS